RPRLVTSDDEIPAPAHEDAAVNWALVAALRAQASDQLSQAATAGRVRHDKATQEELGRAIVLELIDTTVTERVDAGEEAWSQATQEALARAVFDALFRLGRLQPLVD